MSKEIPDHESEQNDHVENEPQEQLSYLSHDELMQKVNEAEQKANQYWERLLRMQAESENAARRTERDVANAHKYALERFVNELLPIIDSLELCVNNAMQNKAEGGAILEGVKLTLKMFYTAMEKFGIEQVDPLGQPFNPEFHQAISIQADKQQAQGVVLSVLQKGYLLNQRLIRPA